MTTIQFLAEWALRSSILIVSGALLLRALRVKDPSLRLGAMTAMLFGSLAIPALTVALPKVSLTVVRLGPARVEAPKTVYYSESEPMHAVSIPEVREEGHGTAVRNRIDWVRAALILYFLVALVLLLRLGYGLALSLLLLRGSHATGQTTAGIEIRESDRVTAPVTLGILRPAIVLPGDWRQWDGAKLKAVLAHECSHIRSHDPAVQLLSSIHRALLWHTPLSWFLHRQIVRVAEEVCDDAAVAATSDRTFYAEVLLDFMRRGVWRASWQGVPVARYGRADERIHRILDGTVLSRGVTRWGLAAILILGLPLAYLAATAQPQSPQQPPAPVQAAGKPSPAVGATELARVVRMGDFHLGRGEWDDAIAYYKEGLRLNPSNADLRLKLDDAISVCKKENTLLHKDFKCGAERAPTTPVPAPTSPKAPQPVRTTILNPYVEIRAKITMGNFYLSRAEYDDAIAAYEDGLKLDPSNTDLRLKLDQAIRDCMTERAAFDGNLRCGGPSRAVIPSPGPSTPSVPSPVVTPSPHPNPAIVGGIKMGDFHLHRGEYDEAIAAYEEGLKADPSNGVLQDKLDSAIAACQQEKVALHAPYTCGGARNPVVKLILSGDYAPWHGAAAKGQLVPDYNIEGGLHPLGSLSVPPSINAPPRAIVSFTIQIDASGNVTPERTLSDENGLAPQILPAVKTWKFKPPTVKGEPVSTLTQVIVIF